MHATRSNSQNINQSKNQGDQMNNNLSNKRKQIKQKDFKQTILQQNQCAICLDDKNSVIGYLDCTHEYCFSCILGWSDLSSICPLCKNDFDVVIKKQPNCEDETIKIQQKQFKLEEESISSIENADDKCYVCLLQNNVYEILVCDQCNFFCCHTYCDKLDKIPDGEWKCLNCRYDEILDENEYLSDSQDYIDEMKQNIIRKSRKSTRQIDINDGIINPIKRKTYQKN